MRRGDFTSLIFLCLLVISCAEKNAAFWVFSCYVFFFPNPTLLSTSETIDLLHFQCLYQQYQTLITY